MKSGCVAKVWSFVNIVCVWIRVRGFHVALTFIYFPLFFPELTHGMRLARDAFRQGPLKLWGGPWRERQLLGVVGAQRYGGDSFLPHQTGRAELGATTLGSAPIPKAIGRGHVLYSACEGRLPAGHPRLFMIGHHGPGRSSRHWGQPGARHTELCRSHVAVLSHAAENCRKRWTK